MNEIKPSIKALLMSAVEVQDEETFTMRKVSDRVS